MKQTEFYVYTGLEVMKSYVYTELDIYETDLSYVQKYNNNVSAIITL